jgi:hypothetical protein
MKWAECFKKKAIMKRIMEEENQIKSEIRSENGLYLVSNACYNPISKNTVYVIKIGIASDISKRMEQYKSTNPMLNHIDFFYGFSKEQGRAIEKVYHKLMRELSYKQIEGTAEWFEVEESKYFNILNKGFGYFTFDNLKFETSNTKTINIVKTVQFYYEIFYNNFSKNH